MSALDELIAAVEAGAISTTLIMDTFGGGWDDVLVLAAFDGSLDAARALHDALLPGWCWFAGHTAAAVWRKGETGNFFEGQPPARAGARGPIGSTLSRRRGH